MQATSLLNSGADVDTVDRVSHTIDIQYEIQNDVCICVSKERQGASKYMYVELGLILKAFSAFRIRTSPTFMSVVMIAIHHCGKSLYRSC